MKLTLSNVGASVVGAAIALFARFITAVRPNWLGIEPTPERRIYFANHVSHGDFVLIWTVLPLPLRRMTRPVAGADYWNKSALKRFIGTNVFNALLIDRERREDTSDPVTQMSNAVDDGASLIIFPEGTRNTTDETLLPFKSGIYHLGKMQPSIDLVPVWIDNLNHVMPKGEIIPLPLICTVTFGEPLKIHESEEKDDFLKRAEEAVKSLNPKANPNEGEG